MTYNVDIDGPDDTYEVVNVDVKYCEEVVVV